MTAILRFVGGAGDARAALADILRAPRVAMTAGEIKSSEIRGNGIETSLATPPATLLVTLAQAPEAAIAAAGDFAEAPATEAEDRLVINIWHMPASADWNASRDAATMATFTRHAARAWAARRVRVNGVTLAMAPDGSCVSDDTVAAAILALWRWRSMTGQVIHLGA